MRRRRWPVALVVVGVLALLVWYVGYTQLVVRQLRQAAGSQGSMYSRIYSALLDSGVVADTGEARRAEDARRQEVEALCGDARSRLRPVIALCAEVQAVRADLDARGSKMDALLFELAEEIRASGLPLVLTDADGRVSASANLPDDTARDSARLQQYVRELDARNPPIIVTGLQGVHYGDSPIVRGLRVIPLLQAAGILLLLSFGVYALVERGRAEREKVWAGMAREAAHQLGTPLSAMAGWLELLRDTVETPTAVRAVTAMEQDLQRLERVSHRFERIGRPPRREEVDCNALVDRLASYFAARAPTLARTVRITSRHPESPVLVHGDGVLLEWVLEVLIKNAIDALGGRDGNVEVSAEPLPEGGARIRVVDDGPGVPRALRRRIFDAGFTTKERGWGIGLSLARRIVEENHGGRLLLAESDRGNDRGAAFDIILSG